MRSPFHFEEEESFMMIFEDDFDLLQKQLAIKPNILKEKKNR